VRDFLAQIEGGVVDERRETTTTEGRRGGNVRLGAGPATAGVDGGRAHQSASEAVVRQTSASEFDRLYNGLEAEGLQVYDVIDESLEALPIGRKDFIEVDARLKTSGLQTLFGLIQTVGQLVPFMEQIGTTAELDSETLQGMQALSAMNQDDRPVSVVATVPGQCGLKIAMELRPTGVRTDDWDTEATVLLKVQRILRPGDRHLVGDPFGGLLRVLPEQRREQALSGLQSGELGDFGIGEAEIGYPGIIGTAIAIYR
jgi:hypothetical protein